MKELVLAEKPSVAKELARVLSCNKPGKGYYEGPAYVVTWALGHLVTLAEPEDYDRKYGEWRLEDLPMLPEQMRLKIIRKTSHQFRTVTDLMKRNDIKSLVIATDAGREGELVARWIMKLASWRKPFTRLWISSQTDKAITEGFRKLRNGKEFDNLYHAAVCRSEADWLIGLNVTRALTCKFDVSLNAGRVQTPTLSIMIARELEIKQFKPVPYYTVVAEFDDYYGTWRNQNGATRIFDATKAEALAAKIKDASGIIEDVAVKAKSEQPPLAYDLTELQRDANRIYNFSAKMTLNLAQSLYERHKILTYPRTDSRYITSDLVPLLPTILQAISDGPYSRFIKSLLQRPLNPGKHFVDDSKVSDHHALIPTDEKARLASLSPEERKLYDLVVRRFVTVLYPPHQYEQITIVTSVKGERFYSQGKATLQEGWRAVSPSPPKRESEREEELPEQTLLRQKVGTEKTVKRVKLNKSLTTPPNRYTEATLLTAMESPGKFIDDEVLRETIKDSGLGTPATRAEIIEKLIDNDYVERQGNRLTPTAKAKQLIEVVPALLKSPELTAQWELRLAGIAKGKQNPEQFMADIRQTAKDLVAQVCQDDSTFKLDNLTQTRCPICGTFMLAIKGRKGAQLKCSDRRCGFTQSERDAAEGGFKKSKHETRMNQRLIKQYSDQSGGTFSLGDLLKKTLKDRQQDQ